MSREIKSSDYHDYFIKNGRFIGEFEQMYQNVEDPWHIDALGRRLDMDAALLLIRRAGRDFRFVLDVGCGKGFFTSLLAETVSGRIWACDVSQTAVAQAQSRHPDPRLHFFAADANQAQALPFADGSFDLIVFAQTLWCVLENIDGVLAAFRRLLAEDGCLLISQHFPPPGRQQYGAGVVGSPEDLIGKLRKAGFDVVSTLETDRLTNHHLALSARPRV